MPTKFTRLNDGWNAEPNAPGPQVEIVGDRLNLTFLANPFQFPSFSDGEKISLAFRRCSKYRLGPTNDEGWYMGQCRFGKDAPNWGEFYEVDGDLKLGEVPEGWIQGSSSSTTTKHFLFYFRDETFECQAESWSRDAA